MDKDGGRDASLTAAPEAVVVVVDRPPVEAHETPPSDADPPADPPKPAAAAAAPLPADDAPDNETYAQMCRRPPAHRTIAIKRADDGAAAGRPIEVDFGNARGHRQDAAFCHTCGGRVLVGSLPRHLATCARRVDQQRKAAEAADERAGYRLGPAPLPNQNNDDGSDEAPLPPLEAGLDAYNAAAATLYLRHVMCRCPSDACRRTFSEQGKLRSHMLHCCPALLPAPAETASVVAAARDGLRNRGSPIGIVCHLCGRRALAGSFGRHVKACADAFTSEHGGTPPPPPDGIEAAMVWAKGVATTPAEQRAVDDGEDATNPLGAATTPAEQRAVDGEDAPRNPLEVYNTAALAVHRSTLPQCPKCARAFAEAGTLAKHMKRCCPSVLASRANRDNEDTGAQRGLVCYLCGRRALLGSIDHHQVACKLAWAYEQQQKPVAERRPLPKPPAVPRPRLGEDTTAYDALALGILEMQSPQCPQCARTFAEERALLAHAAHCCPDYVRLLADDEVISGTAACAFSLRAVVAGAPSPALAERVALAAGTDARRVALGPRSSGGKKTAALASSVRIMGFAQVGHALEAARRLVLLRSDGDENETESAPVTDVRVVPQKVYPIDDVNGADPTVACYMCGKRTNISSIARHHATCKRKAAEDGIATAAPPTLPVPSRPGDAAVAYSAQAERVYAQSSTFHCIGCKRSFGSRDSARKHMSSCCPRRLEALDARAAKPRGGGEDETPPAAWGVLCFLCGERTLSTASFPYHISKCTLRFLADQQTDGKPVTALPAMPPSLPVPNADSTAADVEKWNAEATRIRDAALPRCAACQRTFKDAPTRDAHAARCGVNVVEATRSAWSYVPAEALHECPKCEFKFETEAEADAHVCRTALHCHMCGQYVCAPQSLAPHMVKCFRRHQDAEGLKPRRRQIVVPPPPVVLMPDGRSTGPVGLPHDPLDDEQSPFDNAAAAAEDSTNNASLFPCSRYMCSTCGHVHAIDAPPSTVRAHHAQCVDRQAVRDESVQVAYRRAKPAHPVAIVPAGPGLAADETVLVAWNTAAKKQYETHMSPACDRCNRTFADETALQRHRAACWRCPNHRPVLSLTGPFEWTAHVRKCCPELAPATELAEIPSAEGVLCFLCGRQCMASSYLRHVQGCVLRWISEESSQTASRRRPIPTPPVAPIPVSGSEDDAATLRYNQEAKVIYEDALPRCELCDRSYLDYGRLDLHYGSAHPHIDFTLNFRSLAIPPAILKERLGATLGLNRGAADVRVPWGGKPNRSGTGTRTRVVMFATDLNEAHALSKRLVDLSERDALLPGLSVGLEANSLEVFAYASQKGTLDDGGRRGPRGAYLYRSEKATAGAGGSTTARRTYKQEVIEKENERMAARLERAKTSMKAPSPPGRVLSKGMHALRNRKRQEATEAENSRLQASLRSIYRKKTRLDAYKVPTVNTNDLWWNRTALYDSGHVATRRAAGDDDPEPKAAALSSCSACGVKHWQYASDQRRGTAPLRPCRRGCGKALYCDATCEAVDDRLGHRATCDAYVLNKAVSSKPLAWNATSGVFRQARRMLRAKPKPSAGEILRAMAEMRSVEKVEENADRDHRAKLRAIDDLATRAWEKVRPVADEDADAAPPPQPKAEAHRARVQEEAERLWAWPDAPPPAAY